MKRRLLSAILAVLILGAGSVADRGAFAAAEHADGVHPAATTGYDERVNSVLVARDVIPPADCKHTSDLTFGIADLSTGRLTTLANSLLASVKIEQIGGKPPSCDPTVDQSQNNLDLGYLIRVYSLYNSTSTYHPGRLTSAAEDNLLAQMWTYANAYSKVAKAPDPWNIYDSENHDAAAESFYFLAAQAFSHRAAYAKRSYTDHSTVTQQVKAWHDHWSNYLDERGRRGLFIEKGAPIYHGYTVGAILNIYNFADDPILRKKAEMVLDIDFASYAQEQLGNVWGGPKSRSYPENGPDGTQDSMTNLGNLLWGPSVSKWGDHALTLATSGYVPPPVVDTIATTHTTLAPYAIVNRRPGYGPVGANEGTVDWPVDKSKSVLDYSYVTPSYILGTTLLWPKDKHVAPSSQNRWQGITFDTGGDARIYTQAAPGKTQRTCNDAFLSIQSKNTLITEKRDTGSITKVCAELPTLVYFAQNLDSLVERSKWIFVSEGASYVAVRPATGTYRWLTTAKNQTPDETKRFIQLSAPTAPIVFEAAPASSFTSFQQFQDAIIARPLSYAKAVLHYTSRDATNFTMFHDTTKAPQVNGREIDYKPKAVFNSPFLTSQFVSGKVTIKAGAQRATYDFSNPKNPVKTATP